MKNKHTSRLRNIATILCICMVIGMALSACSTNTNEQQTQAPTEKATTAPAATVAATSATAESGDVWAMEGWEEGPWNEVLPDEPWGNYPKITEEFTWRQTDPSVPRDMDGNLYTTGWPLVEETETLTFFARKSARILDINTHYIVENMEKKTNVKIKWDLAPEAELITKRNLVLASNDYPDVFFGCSFSQTDEMTYGMQQQIIIPLSPLIEKYGYYVKKVLEYRSDLKSWITTPDGNIYTLPWVYNNFHVRYQVKGWINQEWLDTLSLDMPTTTDEYYEVLKAFKEQDPNGNGEVDELPVTGSPSGWNTRVDYFLMMPFISNYSHHRVIEDGTIMMSVNQPEYRQGLQWINKLYDEGLLDRDAFVRDSSQLSQLGNNPDIDVLGSTFAGGYVIFVAAGDRDKAWTAMPPLEGPNGEVNVGYFPFQYSNGQYAITSACENPGTAFRWADWLYSLEYGRVNSYGRLNKEWEYADEGDPDLFGDGQAAYKKIEDETSQDATNIFFEAMSGPYFSPNDAYRAAWSAAGGAEYDTRMYGYTRDLYADKGYEPEEVYPPLYIPVDQLDEYSTITADFYDYVNEAFAKFATGEWDIDDDAQWESYLKDLTNLGIQRLIDIDQAAYDIFLQNQ